MRTLILAFVIGGSVCKEATSEAKCGYLAIERRFGRLCKEKSFLEQQLELEMRMMRLTKSRDHEQHAKKIQILAYLYDRLN